MSLDWQILSQHLPLHCHSPSILQMPSHPSAHLFPLSLISPAVYQPLSTYSPQDCQCCPVAHGLCIQPTAPVFCYLFMYVDLLPVSDLSQALLDLFDCLPSCCLHVNMFLTIALCKCPFILNPQLSVCLSLSAPATKILISIKSCRNYCI